MFVGLSAIKCHFNFQSVDNSLILKLKTENQELKETIKRLRYQMGKYEVKVNAQREKSLAEKEALEKEVEDWKAKLDESNAKLDEKADETELQKVVEEKAKIEEELEEQKVKYNTMEKELFQRISTKEEMEMELKEKNTKLCQEIETKNVSLIYVRKYRFIFGSNELSIALFYNEGLAYDY